MKKLFICLGLVGVLLLTGCDANDEDRELIYKSLQKENIVDKDFEYKELITDVGTVLFLTKDNYHIYENDDEELIAISYVSCNGRYDCDTGFVVTIYDVEPTDLELAYIEEEDIDTAEYYCKFDGKYADNCKYEFKEKEKYNAVKHKRLIFSDYFEFKKMKDEK